MRWEPRTWGDDTGLQIVDCRLPIGLCSEGLPQLAGIGGVVECGIQVNNARADHFLDLGVEVLHPFRTSRLDASEQRVSFVFSILNAVTCLLVDFEDLDHRNSPASVGARNKALGNDV